MAYIESFGAIFSPKDVRDYRVSLSVNSENFPETFELTMPNVKNQGSVGSCVAHSLAIVVEYFSRLQGDETRDMSVGYIYGNRTTSGHYGSGMIVRDALAALAESGDVVQTLFPYNEEVPDILNRFNTSHAKLIAKSYPYRITSYYRVYTETEIKAALMQHGPVVIAMEWFKDIKVKQGIITTEAKTDKKNYSHCIVIYGWNNQGWKIQNSWGTYWGNKGRAILPFNIPIQEAWGVIDNFSEALRKNTIENLELSKNNLLNALEESKNEINSLKQQLQNIIFEKESIDEEARLEINELIKKYQDKDKELKANQEKLEQRDKEILELKNKILEIEKPFNSNLGKIIAKAINLFFKLIKKK